MLNRRYLRIKVLQGLYAYFQDEDNDLLSIEKGIWSSIDKIYDLYISMLLLFTDLKHVAELKAEEAKNKVLPSPEDLSPNLKFINNQVIGLIESNVALKSLSKSRKISWQGTEEQELIKKLFNHIRDTDLYRNYMADSDTSFEADKEFLLEIFKEEIANFELLHNYFEEKSIFWHEDLDLACGAVIKTIRNFEHAAAEKNSVLPLYKDEKDEKEFVTSLYRNTIKSDEETIELIEKFTENWEVDRIAKLDIILMKMAITELIQFPEIPKKVSFNEYIDISKYYSTPKSSIFINGVLDKAVVHLENTGKIKKKGRGLIQ